VVNLISLHHALPISERAFAIVMARQVRAGKLSTTWFDHHNHKFPMVTDLPSHCPDAYKQVVQRRIEFISSRRDLALIERAECKRSEEHTSELQSREK